MARQDRDSQYGGGSYNSSTNNSGRTSSTSGSGGGSGYTSSRESYRTSNAYKAEAKKAAEIAKANKIKQDMVNFKNYSYTSPKFVPSIIGTGLDKLGISKKAFEVNKSYYERNVIGKINPATGKAYSASIEEYQGYLKGRSGGNLDAMGREIVGGNGSGQLVEKNIGGRTLLTTSPTTAEVSQSNAAQVEDSEELRKRRVKAKGRSPTIMTGVTGVTGGLTLGKPSLLGRA